MRKTLAFVRRDFLIETSYRLGFAFQALSILLSVASYYFLARFLEGSAIPGLRAYGGDYFAFVLVGVALHDYLATALEVFSRSVRESQVAGTLEALLATPTSLATIVLASAAYPFLWTSLGVLAYLALGAGLFGLDVHEANWAAAALVLGLAVAAFSGLGLAAASFIMVFKRGSPVAWLVAGLSWLLGGVLYPVTVLPSWLQAAAALLPTTHAIEGMRGALLQSASWEATARSLGALLAFTLVLVPLGLLSFAWATRHARIAGTLAQY